MIPGRHYPATMVETADHDDRVVPAHSDKFAAALQAGQGGDAPVILRVGRRIGLGLGIARAQNIERMADEWAFFWDALED